MKDLTEVKPEYPVIELPQKVLGKDILFAPRPALPAADESAFGAVAGGGISSTQIPTLDNMRSRIDQLEAALIKLGLLKHS